MKALVVFHDHGNHMLAWMLKKGFKHVFVVVCIDDQWVLIDGRAGVPVIEHIPADYVDLAEFYRAEGFTVIETEQRTKPPRSPFAIANCVGLVKATLSIRSNALTPYGLYKYLKRSAHV